MSDYDFVRLLAFSTANDVLSQSQYRTLMLLLPAHSLNWGGGSKTGGESKTKTKTKTGGEGVRDRKNFLNN